VAGDPYNFHRFLKAQESVYQQVLTELRNGQKASHWMWFIFPQLRGLGCSEMANTFAISSREEARAYFQHAILGPRLLECTRLVNLIEGKSVAQIFGYPDDLKFRSSLTLFANAEPAEPVFAEALRKYYDSVPDPRTLALLV
jgi:uncharacterized protein (DUF1810 family)